MTQPRNMAAAARTIAAGGNPLFERTYPHPKHGDLTFRARMPLAVDSLRLSVEVDNLLADLETGPSQQTIILANAIAALTIPAGNAGGKGLLMDVPVISETVENEGTDAERLVRRYYDPAAEADTAFLGRIWMDYSTWRFDLLSDETVQAVGKYSGAPSISSDESSGPSAAVTEPPSQTPVS